MSQKRLKLVFKHVKELWKDKEGRLAENGFLVMFLRFLTIISQIESENLKKSFKEVICDKCISHLDHFTLSEIHESLKEIKSDV